MGQDQVEAANLLSSFDEASSCVSKSQVFASRLQRRAAYAMTSCRLCIALDFKTCTAIDEPVSAASVFYTTSPCISQNA